VLILEATSLSVRAALVSSTASELKWAEKGGSFSLTSGQEPPGCSAAHHVWQGKKQAEQMVLASTMCAKPAKALWEVARPHGLCCEGYAVRGILIHAPCFPINFAAAAWATLRACEHGIPSFGLQSGALRVLAWDEPPRAGGV